MKDSALITVGSGSLVPTVNLQHSPDCVSVCVCERECFQCIVLCTQLAPGQHVANQHEQNMSTDLDSPPALTRDE